MSSSDKYIEPFGQLDVSADQDVVMVSKPVSKKMYLTLKINK